MSNLTIIDFLKRPEEDLTEILLHHGAQVDDWVEKDYGVKIFVTIPEAHRRDLLDEINDNPNYSYEL